MGIVYVIDASAVWTDLKEQSDKRNGSQIFSLHRKIGRLRQANNSLSSYHCRLKQLWDEYSSLVVPHVHVYRLYSKTIPSA